MRRAVAAVLLAVLAAPACASACTSHALARSYHARYGIRLVVGDLSRPHGGVFDES